VEAEGIMLQPRNVLNVNERNFIFDFDEFGLMVELTRAETD